MSLSSWQSPDNKILKTVVSEGVQKCKPTEGSKCKLRITNSTSLESLDHFSNLVIGDVDGDLGRQLEICVTNMFEKEKSNFVVTTDNYVVTLTLELLEMEFAGFLYEWDARKKYSYAEFQNQRGKNHFKNGNLKEAGFRFNKGLKIICSIPIDVQDPPETIDTVSIKEIDQLKATLYNNLAACFFQKEEWPMVISFCDRVFLYDENNVKASYRAAVSYIKDLNFEKADNYLKKVLEKEPTNKSALEHHKFVKIKLREAKEKSDNISKKMIRDILKND
ncbi:FK506-binding protein-like [Coccinella septempunctata]|uniref:FK506-binding protein-like n=1 Tax=Coccinella septempunctata TaxID=41139 RepID=UPI001D061582|nr:FK506-binding protein-like [Coccinella septempunctata]